MTTRRHPATSPNASVEAVRRAPLRSAAGSLRLPPEARGIAAAMFASMPALRAAVRELAARGYGAVDEGAVPADGAVCGVPRGTSAKQPQVTSSPRSANSQGESILAPELSDRGPFAVRELVV